MVEDFTKAFMEVIGSLAHTLGDPRVSILAISIIGNAIPYASVPYYLTLLFYAYRIRDPLELVILAIISGAGATTGKLIIYAFGRGVSKALPERNRRNVELFGKLIKRWGFLFILAVTSTPIPDDVILIPIAFAGYSVMLYFIATLIGKSIVSLLIVFFGRGITQLAEGVGIHQYIQLPLLLGASITLMIIILKIDWASVVKEYESRGVRGALDEIYRNITALMGRRSS